MLVSHVRDAGVGPDGCRVKHLDLRCVLAAGCARRALTSGKTPNCSLDSQTYPERTRGPPPLSWALLGPTSPTLTGPVPPSSHPPLHPPTPWGECGLITHSCPLEVTSWEPPCPELPICLVPRSPWPVTGTASRSPCLKVRPTLRCSSHPEPPGPRHGPDSSSDPFPLSS